jgi:dipeptidyl aminopeptidase/acylaminoacyl peptidase
LKRLFDGKSVELSPSNWIKTNLPPSIIFHGKNDKTIPLPIVEEFARNMEEKGNAVKLLIWEGKGHQFYRWDKESYSEVMDELFLFLKEQFY